MGWFWVNWSTSWSALLNNQLHHSSQTGTRQLRERALDMGQMARDRLSSVENVAHRPLVSRRLIRDAQYPLVTKASKAPRGDDDQPPRLLSGTYYPRRSS